MTNAIAPKVDFYVLDKDSVNERLKFVARLLEKLQKLGKSARILVENDESAQTLDDFLWQFPAESFLPHRRFEPSQASSSEEEQSSSNSPVLIQVANQAVGKSETYDVLIDLSTEAASTQFQHPRIVEVVIQEPGILASTRARYKFYREQGYPLQSHPIQIR
ncbi:DNA polymerase III subunit chi [Aurantivibrio infirmus]